MGVGLGEPELRPVCLIRRPLYSGVITSGSRGGRREERTFRGFPGGVGSKVGGRDSAWCSGKALELVKFGVALQKYIALCL